MNRQVGDSTEEVIITISDDTKILDGVNGYPVEADTLTEGKAVNVYVGPAMTMSLPPIANGDHDHHGCSGGRGVPEIYPGRGALIREVQTESSF